MQFNELVKERRSCRKYQKVEVKDEDIREIIETTLLAPSWKNSETGRYYVANTEESINIIRDALPEFNQNSTVNASYIITSFKKDISGAGGDGMTEEGNLWGAYDLGLQNSYMILKAKDMGYDTVILGLRDVEKIREYFSIPEDEIILPVIAIGKKDQELILRPRKVVDEVLKIK